MMNPLTKTKGLLPRVTLTIKGKDNVDGGFDWSNALIDAAILCGITFAVGFSPIMSDGVATVAEVSNLVCAVVLEFLGFLGLKRNLKEEK